MISAEAVPFAKSGGLADAVTSLSLSLADLGHDVRILMPRYYSVDRKDLNLVTEGMKIQMGNNSEIVNIYQTYLTCKKKVPVYFADDEGLFGRLGIYGDNPASSYADNPYRFSLLSHTAFEFCIKKQWIPDIIHCHDWSSCLALTLLKNIYRFQKPFEKTKGILTIHNMGYQGDFSTDKFSDLGIDWGFFYKAGFEHNYRINFLKAGIVSADKITTVSQRYAQEIQSSEGGFGLESVIKYRSQDLCGIVNGIDVDAWNPQLDKKIPFNFSISDLSGKAKCKEELQKRMGLPVDNNVPVIGIISRLVQQKGISELFAPNYGCMYGLCKKANVQVVVLGSGEKWCESELQILSKELPNFKCFIGYDEDLSHLIESGSDIFLMPSRYEPCGLNQLYSMRYGTLPVVRNTGGLADTVQNYDAVNKTGSGFVCNDATPDAVFGTTMWAIETYYEHKDDFKMLQQNAMSKDFSWINSANQYVKVYQSALEN